MLKKGVVSFLPSATNKANVQPILSVPSYFLFVLKIILFSLPREILSAK